MASSPLAEETNAFSYTIKSGGTEIPGTYEVMSMSITQQVNKIASAEITLRDGSAPSQSFEISDSATFKPGAEIEIELGYQSKNDPIFKGVVTKQTIRVDSGSVSQLSISLKDKAAALTKGKKRINFEKKKDSEIIESIIQNAGLDADVAATSLQYDELTQNDATDWDFINIRAAKNGMFVSTDAGKVIVAKPDAAAEPELEVTYGYDLIDFDTEVDGSDQYSGVECSAWDPKNQEMITASAEDPKINKQGNLSESDLEKVLSAGKLELKTSGTMVKDELKAWATGVYELLSLSRFRGSLSFNGSSKAKVNSTISLKGLSDRFNGNAFITGITHSISGGKWTTKANIGLEPQSFAEKNNVSSPSASGILPGIDGLQTGIVTKIDEDPNSEFRIQVNMPILGSDAKPVWARMSNFYASKEVGVFFLPEINDEVILGFMNNDPTFPVILGSLYSSKLAAPETADDKNSIKTILTKSKIQLKFDDENKILTLVTPGENTVVLDDKDKKININDQNGNKVELTEDGIKLTDKATTYWK